MIELFRNGDPIERRTIRKWADLAPSIRLPSFQRNAVWNEARVELLWDSVTRRMPIGTLLFSRIIDANSSSLPDSPMGRTKPLEYAPSPLLLIDGQQRLTALKLGFTDYDDAQDCRLWIDLAPPKRKEVAARGRYCVCSRIHPWGVGVSVAKRREARRSIGQGDQNDDVCLSLRKTWPLNARVPVDAYSLIRRVLDNPDASPKWMDLLPPSFSPDEQALAETGETEGLESIVRGLRLLDTSFLVGLLVDIQTMEELGEAFSRLNSQGERMSAEELFFSALKLRWEQSRDLVARIVEDPDAGKLIPATKLVHLATRIALSNLKEPPLSLKGLHSDIDALTLAEFDSLERSTEGNLVPQLQLLLKEAGIGDQGGRLHSAMTVARRMLQYRDTSSQSDPGLPHTLLGQLHWRSWHTVAAWAERHCSVPGEIEEEGRLEAIRLVLLLHFFVPTGKALVSREAFRLVRDTSARQFPGRKIAASLLKEGLVSVQPVDPMEFRGWLSNENGSSRGGHLANEQHLLHLAQRHWLHAWYPKHDPTLYHSIDDLPYDVDHLMPDHAFDGRGGSWCQEFQRDAGALRNSVGNLRLWPREANRSDQAATPDAKLFLRDGSETTLVDEPLLQGKPCLFQTAGEVRSASFVLESQCGLWQRTCSEGHLKDWSNADRARALRQAVDERRASLYEMLWRLAGFGSWWNEVRQLSEVL